MNDKQIIEINGIKMEVDMRHAVRMDTFRIGTQVKCLVKEYQSTNVYSGIIIGFDPFKEKPTITVAYIKDDYDPDIIIKAYNSETEGFEIVADVDQTGLDLDRDRFLSKFDKKIQKAQNELDDLVNRRRIFNDKFGTVMGGSET